MPCHVGELLGLGQSLDVQVIVLDIVLVVVPAKNLVFHVVVAAAVLQECAKILVYPLEVSVPQVGALAVESQHVLFVELVHTHQFVCILLLLVDLEGLVLEQVGEIWEQNNSMIAYN